MYCYWYILAMMGFFWTPVLLALAVWELEDVCV